MLRDEADKTIIAWDLGATKCNAGLLLANPSKPEIHCQKTFTIKLREVNSLEELTQQIETHLGIKMSDADAICIGAAGHYDGRTIQHTNPYPYVMAIGDIAEKNKWPRFDVIHDYASIVCATFTQPCKANPYGRRVAFGIGTGLGLKDGILFPNGQFWLGHNEMGHIGITHPPRAEKQDRDRHQALTHFIEKECHEEAITFEKILSGYGLVRLYRFLHPNEKSITPEEVGLKIEAGKETELLDLFAWYAGLFVGTMQLSFMPSGGIYVTGGVSLLYQQIFSNPSFQRGINAIPAYQEQRKEYPLTLLQHPDTALYGCGYYALHNQHLLF